jgi:hypothetical protein
VDSQPDKAALIVRAFRRARQWTAQNPAKAVIAAQATGYYPEAVPVGPSAKRVISFGFDREVDLTQSLERSFADRVASGTIKTDKSPKELVRLYYRRIEGFLSVPGPSSKIDDPRSWRVGYAKASRR